MNEEIINIIANVAEVPSKKINLDTNLVKDLELESLDLVTLVSEFEEKYNITVEDKDIKNLQTVKDIVDYISKNV
ncbi:acyl carrier protein 4 chloroplast putative [Firmicutes bacterium CAG:884]|nr:acyl carrier protein [Bacillota bacterium]CCY94361.1 acyl carrier protein 4 chloroplast putative [Firmicutes bacterium CAG:884]